MASEDVIELGSSDDEAEPATKKMKPRPNAMVHIPTKIHGVTIKPVKSNVSAIPKVLAGKNVTVTKITKGSVSNNVVSNPYSNKQKRNGKVTKPQVGPSLPKSVYNPLHNIVKKISSQVVVNKIPPTPRVLKNPIRIQSPNTLNSLPSCITVKASSNLKRGGAANKTNPIPKKRKLNRVPKPSESEVMTVELDDDDVSSVSTASPQWYVRPEDQLSAEEMNNKEPEPEKPSFVEITIEDSPVKPLPNKRTCEVGAVFSVTIDDSPVKNVTEKDTGSGSDVEDKSKNGEKHSKKKLEYPKESHPGTIEIEVPPPSGEKLVDESNTKNTTNASNTKNSSNSKNNSSTENDSKTKNISNSKNPSNTKNTTNASNTKNASNSKNNSSTENDSNTKNISNTKNPSNTKNTTNASNTINASNSKDNSSTENDSNTKNTSYTNACVVDNIIIEIEESPLKIVSQSTSTSTPKKEHSKARLETAVTMMELQEDEGLGEFHPVYRSFIKLCLQLENSDDMNKIVEKKIKTYYRQVPKSYTESEEFIDMVSSKILAMKAGPEKMYLYIKDIVDELNLQRKLAKSQVLSSINAKTSGSDNFLYGEDSEYDAKRQRQIRKLEKTLKKLHRAIQKLEEQEVDFDDDEDSVYLLTESDEDCTSNKDSDKQLEKDPKALLQRYKERMVRVHAKFCQLTNTKMPSEPRVQIDARPGQPQGPAKRLEKWVNKKVPIGTPLPFPDFHDVLRCVREANDEDKLGWNEADIMEEARDLFTRCGKKLQRRRQENEWRLAASRIPADVDPAEKSVDLKRKLEENKKTATKKETEVFNKFADRQKQLQLEGEEIGDKEAEESPIESEEDEPADESSLQNTEKRKERLKRLLQEKSKKTCEEELLKESNIEVKSKEVESEKKPEENTTADRITTNESKDKIESADTEDKNEANKENQISITDIKTQDKSDEKDKPAEGDKRENQDPLEVKAKPEDDGKIHSLSDDSTQLESDVDELHLLQKLHSENEMYTTSELSCSDTPIAISDTLESSEDSKKRVSDVISIENSSYSESEANKNAIDISDKVKTILPDKTQVDEDISDKVETNMPETVQVDEDLTQHDTEMECSSSGVVKKIVKTNNDEYNQSIEDILLASTDDEADVEKDPVPANEEEPFNLKDDTLSIGETVVETAGDKIEKDNLKKHDDTSSIESVTLVSVSEPLTEADQEKVQNDATENNLSIVETLVETAGANIEKDKLKKQEDTSSLESVTLVSVSEPLTETGEEKVQNDAKENDLSICETVVETAGDNIEKENLKKQEDTSSLENVTLVSVSEPLTETGEEKVQHGATENNSAEKQDDVASVDSLNVILDTNSEDTEPEEKICVIHGATGDDNTDILENNVRNNTDEATRVKSAEDEKSTDIDKPVDSEKTQDKEKNDDSTINDLH